MRYEGISVNWERVLLCCLPTKKVELHEPW